MASPLKVPSNFSVSQDLTGASIGRFVICSKLGAGGMGEVYRAEDTKLKRMVALKRIAPKLRSDQNYRRRFLREAEYASRLNESHIASIFDVMEESGETFLVMEYVEGQTLRHRLAQPLGFEEFQTIATQCAAALAAAHERHLVHGDIKPENIMLTPTGQVKILDFGVAKVLPEKDHTAALDQDTTWSRVLGGTPSYMAPEVLLEKIPDGRADLFSLGVVFYEALTGTQPFHADSFIATSKRILEEVPPAVSHFNSRFPAELDRIVGKLLEKDPNDRYATAADLLVDLRALQKPRSKSPQSRPVFRARLLKQFATASGVAIVILTVLMSVPSARQRFESWFGIHSVVAEKLVAVLPFTVADGNTQVTSFSDGLTETLTTKLTQLTVDPVLQVVPAAEVQRKHVKTKDEARSEFGATTVVEGTLQRSGDQVRIDLALVDTRTRQQMRAESLTIAASDPFAIQDRIVNAAVEMLELDVPPRERETLEAHGTEVATAYDYYLQGRGYLQNYDNVKNIENAISVFDRALQLDSDYALAYAGRGDAYWLLYESTKDPQWVEDSRRDCDRALNLNKQLSAAHICLGTIDKGTGHYSEAATEFERVIETEPTNDRAYLELAEAYERLGKSAQAEATYRRAIKLRPHYWAGYNWLGVFYYRGAHYQEAVEMFEQVVALAPDNVRGLYNLATAYISQGRYVDAVVFLKRSIAIRPAATAFTDLGNAYFYLRRFDAATEAYEEAVKLNDADVLLWWNLGDGYYWSPGRRGEAVGAYRHGISLAKTKLSINPKDGYTLGIAAVCYAMLGDKKQALESLQEALRISPGDPEMLFKAALIHNQFGNISQALIWLEKATSAGFSRSTIWNTPDFDHLHNDPRFQKLLWAQ